MELLTVSLFCVSLLVCILLKVSILYAMLAGLLIFAVYGMRKGFSLYEILGFAFAGIKTAKNVLLTFFLIGMLTALWRASGTIPLIVTYAAKAVHPSIFLLMTFLLNCLVSVLTGTSFGTAATMGVICSAMGASLGVPPILLGGAVLSGVYFGDRCSPVSTSALLTAALTETDIFSNIKAMLRSALIPFLLSCAVYGILGLLCGGSGSVPDLDAVFSKELVLSTYALLPAVVLLLLSLFKVDVKITMAASILTALPVCLAVQHMQPSEIPRLLLSGYTAADGELNAMLGGGGIVSMLRVAAIVCISSAYSGIFRSTGLLNGIESGIRRLAVRTTPFAAILLTSVVTGMISCNQTLTIMLTQQLCTDAEPDRRRLALSLEDSAVVVAPLIPWSIAGAVPLASVGAPTLSVAFACFLYLLPLRQLALSLYRKRHMKKQDLPS